MLCALTVRTLKPGTFDQFREAFMRPTESQSPPPGWVRFNMVRSAQDPDEVVCFGFFDRTLEQLQASQSDAGREAQLREIDQFVESTGADGIYDVVEDLAAAERTPA